MKRIMCLVILLLLTVSSAFAYTGNSKSLKFHYEGCRAEQKISQSNRVHFDTRDEAVSHGYKPCGICKP